MKKRGRDEKRWRFVKYLTKNYIYVKIKSNIYKITMAIFELADEEPVINNSTVALQAQEMFIGQHKEWAEMNSDVIMALDEETAKKVDDCVTNFDWIKQKGDEDLSHVDDIISQFLNKRPDKYRKAARERRKAGGQIIGSVRKAIEPDKSKAS